MPFGIKTQKIEKNKVNPGIKLLSSLLLLLSLHILSCLSMTGVKKKQYMEKRRWRTVWGFVTVKGNWETCIRNMTQDRRKRSWMEDKKRLNSAAWYTSRDERRAVRFPSCLFFIDIPPFNLMYGTLSSLSHTVCILYSLPAVFDRTPDPCITTGDTSKMQLSRRKKQKLEIGTNTGQRRQRKTCTSTVVLLPKTFEVHVHVVPSWVVSWGWDSTFTTTKRILYITLEE